MKYLFIVFTCIFFLNTNSQCIVDAGPDVYVCVDKFGVTDSSILQANMVSSISPDSIYWSSNHWFLNTEDIIDSINIFQPLIYSNGGITGGDPPTFIITVKDSLGNICKDSTKVIFSSFAIIPIYYVEINEKDTLNLFSIVGGGIPPLTVSNWSPLYNIDTITGKAWPMVSTTYSHTVTDSIGCVNTFGNSLFVKVLPFGTNIINLTHNKLNVFPNPSSGMFNFSFKEKLLNLQILVTNSMGQVVVNQKLKENQIDLTYLPIGLYNFKIYYKTKTISIGNLIKE